MGISEKLNKAIKEMDQIANNIKKNEKVEGCTDDINSTTIRPMSRMRPMSFSTEEPSEIKKVETKVLDILGDILNG